MKTGLKIALFFLIPIVAVILYPPATIIKGVPVIIFAIVAFSLLGVTLLRGKKWALNFLIFLLGFNVIVRLMMFVSQVVPENGSLDPWFLVTSILSIGISLWLLLRLDHVDVRTAVVY